MSRRRTEEQHAVVLGGGNRLSGTAKLRNLRSKKCRKLTTSGLSFIKRHKCFPTCGDSTGAKGGGRCISFAGQPVRDVREVFCTACTSRGVPKEAGKGKEGGGKQIRNGERTVRAYVSGHRRALAIARETHKRREGLRKSFKRGETCYAILTVKKKGEEKSLTRH